MTKYVLGVVIISIIFLSIAQVEVRAQTSTSTSSTSTSTSSSTSSVSTTTTSSASTTTSSEVSTTSSIESSSSSEEVIQESSYSPVQQIPVDVIDLKKVFAPRNVSAELVFNDKDSTYSIELQWEASKSEGIEKYLIFRSEGNRLNFVKIAEASNTDTQYIDKDFNTDKTYYYVLQSVKGTDKSKDSNEAVVQITKETQMEAQQVERESKDSFWSTFIIVNVAVWLIIFLGFLIYKIIKKIRARKNLNNKTIAEKSSTKQTELQIKQNI